MKGRMGTTADAVLRAGSVAALLASAEPIVDGGAVPIKGRVESDGAGPFVSIEADGPEQVGTLIVDPEGGTGADRIPQDAPDGIAMVLDPYACEFSFYIKNGDGVRPARVLMEE